ncbi:Uncharacterised protein [Vibrio cholerae]|nr:Uncharacterised protein [Vibrio cholerae]CSI89026.1 Uncharacterised protein [Vibrio cholerae]
MERIRYHASLNLIHKSRTRCGCPLGSTRNLANLAVHIRSFLAVRLTYLALAWRLS